MMIYTVNSYGSDRKVAESEEKGIRLNYFKEEVLFKLLEYSKSHYDEVYSFFIDISSFNNKSLYKVLRENSLMNRLTNKEAYSFYIKYKDIFDILCEDDFPFRKKEYVPFFLHVLSLTKDVEKRDEVFDKIISNLKKVFNMDITDIYFDANGDKVLRLNYQPWGNRSDARLCVIYYREENFYTDASFRALENKDAFCVDVVLENPKFVIKGFNMSAFSLGDRNFKKKEWNMHIYDLLFDEALLPSYEDLKVTKCDLEEYRKLEFDKKLGVVLEKLETFEKASYALDKSLDRLLDSNPSFMDEYDDFDDIFDGITDDGQVEKVKKLIKSKGVKKV